MSIENLENAIVAALAANPDAYRTNTPLEVLAAHMVRSMESFEWALLARSMHPFFAPGKRDA
jgi:hypothetical protein